MLYKISVSQGEQVKFTIPSEKREKWLNETELSGAIKLAGKINENNLVRNKIPTILLS